MSIPKQVLEQERQIEALEKHIKEGGEPEKVDKPKEKNDNVDWEKRFKGLKKAHDEQIYQMRNQIAELKEKLEAKEAEPVDPTDVLSEEERENYTPEFIDMVARVAKKVDEGSVMSRLERIEQEHVRSAEDRFWDELKQAIPNWQEIQETDGMQAWLSEYDDLLGMTRNMAIQEAQERLDSRRVIAIFKMYLNSAGSPVGGQSGEEMLLTPDSSTVSNQVDASGRKIFKMSEVDEFYKKLALGKFKTREQQQEALRFEKEIELAANEGRIVNG